MRQILHLQGLGMQTDAAYIVQFSIWKMSSHFLQTLLFCHVAALAALWFILSLLSGMWFILAGLWVVLSLLHHVRLHRVRMSACPIMTTLEHMKVIWARWFNDNFLFRVYSDVYYRLQTMRTQSLSSSQCCVFKVLRWRVREYDYRHTLWLFILLLQRQSVDCFYTLGLTPLTRRFNACNASTRLYQWFPMQKCRVWTPLTRVTRLVWPYR